MPLQSKYHSNHCTAKKTEARRGRAILQTAKPWVSHTALGSPTPDPTLSVRFPLLSTSLTPPACSYLLALVDSYSALPSCPAQVPSLSPLNQGKSWAHCVQRSAGTRPGFRWTKWPFPLCSSPSGPGLSGKSFTLTAGCLEKKGPSFCFLISLAITDSTNHCQGCQATLRHGSAEVTLQAQGA